MRKEPRARGGIVQIKPLKALHTQQQRRPTRSAKAVSAAEARSDLLLFRILTVRRNTVQRNPFSGSYLLGERVAPPIGEVAPANQLLRVLRPHRPTCLDDQSHLELRWPYFGEQIKPLGEPSAVDATAAAGLEVRLREEQRHEANALRRLHFAEDLGGLWQAACAAELYRNAVLEVIAGSPECLRFEPCQR